MSSTPLTEWLDERAQPFYVTVYRIADVWQVVICRTGVTMSERLNPETMFVMHIPRDRAALLSTNRELLAEVASMTIDVADGVAVAARA